MEKINGEGLFAGSRKVKRYSPELKKKVIDRVLSGESVPLICRELGIDAVSTVHGWIYQARRKSGNPETIACHVPDNRSQFEGVESHITEPPSKG